MGQGQYYFSFQVRNCWTKEPNNFMENTHRWSKGLRCWVCPASPVPPSCPSLTPVGDRRVTLLQCHHLLLQEDYTTTHGSSSQWVAFATIICMLELQTRSYRVPFHRSGALMVVPLSMPDEVPELSLSWHGKKHWKWASDQCGPSVPLSKCYWFTLSGCRHRESVYTFISGCLCSILADVLSQEIFWRQRQQ